MTTDGVVSALGDSGLIPVRGRRSRVPIADAKKLGNPTQTMDMLGTEICRTESFVKKNQSVAYLRRYVRLID
jgi:hypothetical protein